MAGSEAICKLPLKEARQKVSHPVTCADCHDPARKRARQC